MRQCTRTVKLEGQLINFLIGLRGRGATRLHFVKLVSEERQESSGGEVESKGESRGSIDTVREEGKFCYTG